MTKLECRNIDVFIKQNDATIADFAEGCLIDNFLLQCKHGVAVVVEKICQFKPKRSHNHVCTLWKQGRNKRTLSLLG